MSCQVGTKSTACLRRLRGNVLIADADAKLLASLGKQLDGMGFATLLARSGSEAVSIFDRHSVDIVIVKSVLHDMDVCDLIGHVKQTDDEKFIPVLFITDHEHEDMLMEYMVAGADDYLLSPYTTTGLSIRMSSLEQLCELKRLYGSILQEELVAKQILASALHARSSVIRDMRVLSKSADVFSGDLVMSARHPDGDLLILLADFTGHGLSAAIGVLPVADVFSAMVDKGFKPQQILDSINRKLLTLLPTGMFMAACMLKIDKGLDHAHIWNGGMPEVILLDNRTGSVKSRSASKHLPLGISGPVERSFLMEKIDIEAGDHFIMYSDGLTEATNATGTMFGASRLNWVIEASNSSEQVFPAIVNAFEEFCDHQHPQDDVTLINIPCNQAVMKPPVSLQHAIYE